MLQFSLSEFRDKVCNVEMSHRCVQSVKKVPMSDLSRLLVSLITSKQCIFGSVSVAD